MQIWLNFFKKNLAPRLNLFCMGCQRRVALPTQTKIILELSIIVALIVMNCL